ncbi:MAG: hypothetical protein ACFCUX_07035 [Candidatus Methylacidiphilales bacterium]
MNLNPITSLLSALPMLLIVTGCQEAPVSVIMPAGQAGALLPQTFENDKVNVELPAEWIPEPVFGMREASFRIPGPKGTEAEVSISTLPLSGGTLASNLLRWRSQAGHPSVDEATCLKETRPGQVSGHKAVLVQWDAYTDQHPAVYGAVLESGDTRYFIKFSGPGAWVKEQAAAWDQFLQSLVLKELKS